MKSKLIYIIGSSLITGSLVFGGTAFASSARPAIFGQVAAISGREITVTGKSGKQGIVTTYTVDAGKAKITQGLGQGATAIDLSNVEVGDKVAVLGSITGDAVVASSVFDKTMKPSAKKNKQTTS